MKETAFVRASAAAAAVTSPGLPVDLQEQAVRRVAWFALLVGIGGVLPLVGPMVIPGLELLSHGIRSAVLVPFIAFAFALAWLGFRGRLPPERVLDLALVFQVAGVIVISSTTTGSWPIEHGAPRWPPVAIFLLLAPVIIPSTTRRALLAAVVSALVDVMAVYAVVALGLAEMPSVEAAVRRFFPVLAAVPLSLLASRLVNRLGDEIRAARAMGSYRLVAKLGEGGMGEVWRASHGLLSRDAAVKLIRPEALGGSVDSDVRRSARARFDREAQAIAALRSPHTIQLYDYGATNDGTLYYVMELLDGFDLETLVAQEGPLPAERVVHLLRQACHSLREAHDAGLIHRDVKPANLFVCRQGGDVDRLKVLDFGLVAERRTTAGGGEERTIAGTPAYIAPESVTGTHPLDARADIYALGCVAYFLLTGQTVFDADTMTQMLVQHATIEPEPPSSRTELSIPDALEVVVLACLAKSPDDRPPSARELDARLAAVRLEDAWTEERAREWWDVRAKRAAGG